MHSNLNGFCFLSGVYLLLILSSILMTGRVETTDFGGPQDDGYLTFALSLRFLLNNFRSFFTRHNFPAGFIFLYMHARATKGDVKG